MFRSLCNLSGIRSLIVYQSCDAPYTACQTRRASLGIIYSNNSTWSFIDRQSPRIQVDRPAGAWTELEREHLISDRIGSSKNLYSRIALGRAALVSIIMLLASVQFGCAPEATETAELPEGWPAQLNLGYIHGEDLSGDKEAALQAMATALQKALNIPVALVPTAAYGSAIEALADERIDLMRLSAYTYVLASDAGSSEAIVSYAPTESVPYYQSALITHPSSGLSQLSDLKDKASELRFLYNDPASLSGYLVPKAMLHSHGIDPLEDFAAQGFSYSHYASIFSVVTRSSDLAAVSLGRLEQLLEEEKIREDEVVVLWKSFPLPWGAYAIRSQLPADLKSLAQRTLIELREKDPATWSSVIRQHDDADIRYFAAEDSQFNELRELRRRIENPVDGESWNLFETSWNDGE